MQEGDMVKLDLLVTHSGSRKSKAAWGRIKKFMEESCQLPTTGNKSKPADITPMCKTCGRKKPCSCLPGSSACGFFRTPA